MTLLTAQQRDIVATARSYLGTRWRHQGRTRDGIDCIGLVIEVAKQVKGWTYDVTDYAREATDETMLNLCRQHLVAKGLNEAQPGDVLIMAFENQRHAAIVGDYPAPHEVSIIHAYATSRAVVEQRLDTMWSNRVIGCFCFPEGQK